MKMCWSDFSLFVSWSAFFKRNQVKLKVIFKKTKWGVSLVDLFTNFLKSGPQTAQYSFTIYSIWKVKCTALVVILKHAEEKAIFSNFFFNLRDPELAKSLESWRRPTLLLKSRKFAHSQPPTKDQSQLQLMSGWSVPKRQLAIGWTEGVKWRRHLCAASRHC